MRQPHLVFVTTVPATAYHFLRGQLTALREAGFRVSVVSSPGPELWEVGKREGVDTFPIEIPREIEPFGDAIALLQLTDLFNRIQPDIVQASTPKGGLLGMLAARAARVPHRIYLLRGLRLETTTGGLRTILGTTERLAAGAAHQVVCVSHSLREVFVDAGYAPAAKCVVLGAGSSNGVRADHYARTPANVQRAQALADELGLPAGAPVIGFAGRMVEDKGILPLLTAFEQVRAAVPNAQLVMVGDSFAGDRVDPAIKARVLALGAHVVPFLADLGPFYALLDVLAFPSLREGFPNVPLEAAAAGVPVVGFHTTGVVDAVQDGVTGTLVDEDGLGAGLLGYLLDPALQRRHSAAAVARVQREFRPEVVWQAWIELYGRCLTQ